MANRGFWVRWLRAAFVVALMSSAAHAAEIRYDGRLDDGGKPANGRYDLRVRAFNRRSDGVALAEAIEFPAVQVVDGRFRLDFPLDAPDRVEAWLELEVRDAGAGDYVRVPSRTKAVAATSVGLCWSTTGDSGTDPATNFLGTIDAQPFVVRTSNVQSLRVEPSDVLAGGLPITANVIAGSSENGVDAGVRGATIAGGGTPGGDVEPIYVLEGPNRVTGDYGSVGGGYANRAGQLGHIGGGYANVAGGSSNTIGGGRSNTTDANASTIGGGENNVASGSSTTVAGGGFNTASGLGATIGGGAGNFATARTATVAGGLENSAQAVNATIGGGESQLASGDSSTIAGGLDNTASGNGSTIGGGESNAATGLRATIAGGFDNDAGADSATVGGGESNAANATRATIAGGFDNSIPFTGNSAFIGGGFLNVASGGGATIAGGARNEAISIDTSIGGGSFNIASGDWATIGGGNGNGTGAPYATVPGGSDNCAGGQYSWAGGNHAKVRLPANAVDVGLACTDVARTTLGDSGTFVWADGQVSDFISSGPNQFAVRASGGVYFGIAAPVSIPAGRFINTSTGAHLTSGGVWTNNSSRALKTGFADIDVRAVLERVLDLPLTRWRYRASPGEGEHIGPVAEDFFAAFGLGADGRTISTVDASGVALAAIQGLHALLSSENAELRARNDALQRRIAATESESAALRAELDALRELVLGLDGGVR